MKASDLMIGDWVIVYEKAMPVKARVEGVFERGAMVLGHVRSANYGFIEPIPLTPEILEKNGWEWDGELWVTDDFLIEDGYDYYNRFWWSIFNYPLLPINSVHQLQHALRLYGIDKEIVL